MKEVIVFGGSGFLGSYVADELTRRGFDVVVADLHESKYIHGKQKFKKGEIVDCFFPNQPNNNFL